MAEHFQIQGLEDVQAKLQALGNQKEIKKFVRKASRQAMNIVRDAARNNANLLMILFHLKKFTKISLCHQVKPRTKTVLKCG